MAKGGKGETSHHARTTKMAKCEEGGINQTGTQARARAHTHTHTYIHRTVPSQAYFVPLKERTWLTKTCHFIQFQWHKDNPYFAVSFSQMDQFPRTVYCHLQAVLIYVGVTDRRRTRDRKGVHEGKFSNTPFKVFNEKCAIYVVHQLRSKT